MSNNGENYELFYICFFFFFFHLKVMLIIPSCAK